jgi:hypothetical protein
MHTVVVENMAQDWEAGTVCGGVGGGVAVLGLDGVVGNFGFLVARTAKQPPFFILKINSRSVKDDQ